MKILILGGDGYCGWPVALHLANNGHAVTIVDNLSRRRIDSELGISSLTPIQNIENRLQAWRDLGANPIDYINIDLSSDFDATCDLVRELNPSTIVHLAAQRSVPYSMSSVRRRLYTGRNNTLATYHLLAALVESGVDAHVVHLSSVGVYGYETHGYRVPDGYAEMSIKSASGDWHALEALHPTNPVSAYHLTKCQDQLAMAFFSKSDGLRITSLVQGTVWGTQTPETMLDERLTNRFDYDSIYGTVLNRFVLQAALGHPLTVYGTGDQTRGFIHLNDAIQCIQLAIDHPPRRGDRLRIFNQIAETRRIADVAHLVARTFPGTEVKMIDNPRNEPPSNSLEVSNEELRSIGFVPRTMAESLLTEAMTTVAQYAHRCDRSKILS